ncbi:Ketosteroid isomerase homolog [Pedobacter westerhofensis]|uniref:Ketosteroid isomerase homolog n=1 Tax=Pedobacter westerhofensis TaxID=425512 RepID=A0A521CW80_9SPHI|nr:nuclear transport factor 2 family protein [Pedobacter westerhofensis]SMO63706.1 Ketosteroid isomerase homolog [Pedobacter westerhofensis]
MKRTTLPLIALLFGCVVFGFTAKNRPGITGKVTHPSDAELAKNEIVSLNRQFSESLHNADTESAAKIYTVDAKHMPPNSPAVEGRESIKQFYNQKIDQNGLDLVLTTLAVWGNSNMVTEEGTYVVKTIEGVQWEVGKYLSLWKKENGKWRIFRQCYNSDRPAM